MEEPKMETGTEIAKPQDHRPEWYENLRLEDAEKFLRAHLNSAARNVIAVGYYLKNIRDNQLYLEAGYENIWDYAQEQYGFSRSTASRYMSRNDRFSKGGNSPVLDEKYRDFNKSQLQEMLSLDEEQLEQVTPDMTVKQIRELRTPKEIPYFPIEGQMNLEDFPEILPEEREQTAGIPEEILTLEELAGEDPEGGMPEAEPDWEVRATSQQIPEAVAEPLSAYGTPKRVYPPDSLLAVEGCEGGPHDCFSCAMDCPIRGKERYCRESPLGHPFPCEIVIWGFENLPESCQFVNHDLAEHCAGSGEPSPCCKNCKDPCEYICGRAMKALDTGAKIPETTDEPDDTDLELICKMLEKEKKDLDETEKVHQEEPDPTLEKIIRKKRLLIRAIEGLLGEMDQPEKEEPEQPDLPNLKNNDQRKEWLNTYHDWPVWFEVPEAAEVYYRYDLSDGSSLVICEYHYWLEWMDRYGDEPDRTGTREYLLTPGYHYLEDCKSNRTTMIDKLKEVQRRQS